MATLRVLDQTEWNEIRTAAQELKGLGGDAVRPLRRAIREAGESEPEPEPEDRAKAILGALKWLTTPEAKRSVRPPELTPLSQAEARAILAALKAVERGVPVAAIVSAELAVEEVFQSPEDREKGRVCPWLSLPPILEILRREPFALHSYRIRRAFTPWLLGASAADRKKVLAALTEEWHSSGPDRDYLASSVFCAVEFFRGRGMTKREAEQAVSRGETPSELPVPKRPALSYTSREKTRGLPASGLLGWRDELPLRAQMVKRVQSKLPSLYREGARLEVEGHEIPTDLRSEIDAVVVELSRSGPMLSMDHESDSVEVYRHVLEPIPPMPVSTVQALLRHAERNLGVPPRVKPHKRPNRSKPQTP